MSIFKLPNYQITKLSFPPPHLADSDGLLAIGGDLSVERLLLAYRNGIFPWYDEEPILWWSPDPRFVIFPDEFKLNKTVKQLIKKNAFAFTVNKAFPDVIRQCRKVMRPGQDGTWITKDVEEAYTRLHTLGHAHSAEVWQEGKLVGGLYGIRMGRVFFGESMFSLVSNASRYAFAQYMEVLKAADVQLVDCQVHTEYLESMGARMISGNEFRDHLQQLIP